MMDDSEFDPTRVHNAQFPDPPRLAPPPRASLLSRMREHVRIAFDPGRNRVITISALTAIVLLASGSVAYGLGVFDGLFQPPGPVTTEPPTSASPTMTTSATPFEDEPVAITQIPAVTTAEDGTWTYVTNAAGEVLDTNGVAIPGSSIDRPYGNQTENGLPPRTGTAVDAFGNEIDLTTLPGCVGYIPPAHIPPEETPDPTQTTSSANGSNGPGGTYVPPFQPRPTTSDPTISQPTSSDPTTSEPTTAEPTTSDPPTEDPPTQDPPTTDPATSDAVPTEENSQPGESTV